jgi:hypothetical protein
MKKCFRCLKQKPISEFYLHPQMKDGHLGKCIQCTKKDASKRTIKKTCFVCKKTFFTWPTEIKRGGGITCSRKCYYERLRVIIKKGEDSPSWKGNNVGRTALHNLVERELGKPKECEHCKSKEEKIYDWANKSGNYLRDKKDWIRLCRKCHAKYDYNSFIKKRGWKIIKYKNTEGTLRQICLKLGLPVNKIYQRIQRDGWDIEKALNTP